jgi:alpha-L-arabinofuranosidase
MFELKPAKFPLLLIGIISAATLFLSHGLSAQSKTDSAIPVLLKRQENAPAISQLLFGSQYNFFSAPTKDLLKNEYLLKTWEEMPVLALRYPGGTWGDHYLWDKPKSSYYAVGNAQTIITPEQFIENCYDIGAEPIFQVNTSMLNGEGSYINPGKLEDIQAGADRAARWVYEANIRQQWGVRYWEIGNEVWIWLKPEEYARYVVEYSKAMKAIDPTIKIIACGLAKKVGPFEPVWLKFPDDPTWSRPEISNEPEAWNQALLDGADGYFDYIAPHIYIESGDGNLAASERFAKTNALIHANHALRFQSSLRNMTGELVKIAITEWATNFRQSVPVRRSTVPLTEQYYYSLGNGLNTAFMFGKIVESSSEIAILHSLDDFQTLWYWPRKELAENGPLLHPVYYAMKLWGHHLGETPLVVERGECPQLAFEDTEFPAIYVYASEDSNNLYAVVINLDPDRSHEVSLTFPEGLWEETVELTWMKGNEISSQNFAAWDGAAPEEVLLTEESVTETESGFPLMMPAHSMVGVTMPKQQE